MAGIFNLFDAIPQTDKGQVMKPLVRSKTSLGTSPMPLKGFNQQKPKGLSIRSNSNINIPVTPSFNVSKQGGCNNNQPKFLKPKLTQLDDNGRPVSPVKQISAKKLSIQPVKAKGLPPKKESRKKSMKIWEPPPENVFKVPLPPNRKVRKSSLPEPEELAPCDDMEREFNDIYTSIQQEFEELLKKKKKERMKVMPYEDEGFESDSEQICVEVPTLSVSPQSFGKEWKKDWTPELPEISHDSD